MKFIVELNAHISESERQGLLAEIADRHEALYTLRTDGIVETTDFRKSQTDWIKSCLTDEEKRGILRHWLET